MIPSQPSSPAMTPEALAYRAIDLVLATCDARRADIGETRAAIVAMFASAQPAPAPQETACEPCHGTGVVPVWDSERPDDWYQRSCPKCRGPKDVVGTHYDALDIALPDAEFIAHAASDLRACLVEIDRLAAEVDRLRGEKAALLACCCGSVANQLQRNSLPRMDIICPYCDLLSHRER